MTAPTTVAVGDIVPGRPARPGGADTALEARAANPTCADCGTEGPLHARGRCSACYQRRLRALKAAGTYQALNEPRPIVERLWEKTTPGWGGCIIWTAGVTPEGYGTIEIRGKGRKALYVHRVAYELMIGPIPEGMHLDHVCHNRDLSCLGREKCLHRRCVNPHHLEPVTPRENQHRSPLTITGRNARKTRCINGHPFDEDGQDGGSRG
ncbi:HNH endonuclease signature motif containing protein [Streptomyces sp.]|uniref:HNH endonuclease signature motif containing protein n=1 Tax=Streptomyces sp. TaxID=1931 RepID=UPI002F42543F